MFCAVAYLNNIIWLHIAYGLGLAGKSGCVIKCVIGVKINRKAAGQGSFAGCEARQSSVLSILPLCKGSAEWYKTNRQADLEM